MSIRNRELWRLVQVEDLWVEALLCGARVPDFWDKRSLPEILDWQVILGGRWDRAWLKDQHTFIVRQFSG